MEVRCSRRNRDAVDPALCGGARSINGTEQSLRYLTRRDDQRIQPPPVVARRIKRTARAHHGIDP